MFSFDPMRRETRQLAHNQFVAILGGAAACDGGGTDAGGAEEATIPGYDHLFARSRFKLGDLIDARDELGMHKIQGSKGTFATVVASRAAVALPADPVPNPVAPDIFPGDAAAQNAAVLAYFTEAGLQADQVVSVTADETGVSPMDDFPHPLVIAWFSTLNRGFEGTPIEDSMAWAILGAAGDSLEEQVYWPAIGGAALKEVRQFRAMLSDPARGAAYLVRLPDADAAAGGELVLHHTSWDWQGPFEARGSYRVMVSGTVVHFDMTGHVLELANETPSGNVVTSGDGVACPRAPVASVPTGACAGAGVCAVQLQVACVPGVPFIPSTPPLYFCGCAGGSWTCALRSGGGGLLACP
jgi:hypothetical protein